MRRHGMWWTCVVAAGLVAAGAARGEQISGKKRRPLPYEYGRVVINNRSDAARIAPVVFEHWSHRAKFTCRVCHVDIGFAMKAGGSDIKAADNMNGFYCGACHNGRYVHGGTKVFESCAPSASGRTTCGRCHSGGKGTDAAAEFSAFATGLPRGRYGNGIDWEKAEEDRLIKPVDFIEGISIKRQSLTAQKDFLLSPKLQGMPDILFSHKKHTVWNGCELCHPEIFVGVKRGAQKYTMVEIFEGKYCGVCHTSVAFPTIDCQRCHVKPVQ